MKNSTQRASAWSVTINNPIPADDENIALARQRGWKVDGQLEKGKEGTPHYQLIVKTPQVRFSAIKSQFPRAHIEVARNIAALEEYVHKDETKEGDLPTPNEMYPSLSKLWELFEDWIDYHNWDMAKETWGEDSWLHHFDEFIKSLITDGYHVETMGVNPQVRGCVKKYGREIIIRVKNIRRQTDRQTDTESISRSSITEECQWEQESVVSVAMSSPEGIVRSRM